MNKEEFKSKLKLTIEVKYLELIRKRDGSCLSHPDEIEITNGVKRIFVSALGFIPREIEVPCLLSEAVLAPSIREKAELIKKAKGVGTGLAGLAAIISAIAIALGWGAGVKVAIITFFVGTSMLGPLGLAIGGAALLVIAGYFMFHDDKEKLSEKFKKSLENGLDVAVDEIWDEYKDKFGAINNMKHGSNSQNNS